MVDEGVLRIELIEAKFDHDLETFGKMDPYVHFQIREEEWTSKECKNGGKHPHWVEMGDNVWECKIHYFGDDVKFKCMDKEVLKDRPIGEGEAKLSALCCDGGMDEWYPVFHEGKEEGKIHIKAHYTKNE